MGVYVFYVSVYIVGITIKHICNLTLVTKLHIFVLPEYRDGVSDVAKAKLAERHCLDRMLIKVPI